MMHQTLTTPEVNLGLVIRSGMNAFWHSFAPEEVWRRTQQLAVHAPCYFLSNTPLISFRLPLPCFHAWLAAAFVQWQRSSSVRRGVGARGWWWWCWGPVAGLCRKMAGGGSLVRPSPPSHVQLLRNIRFSSWGLPVVTSVNKPVCCSLFLPGFTPPSTSRPPPSLFKPLSTCKWNTSLLTVMYYAKTNGSLVIDSPSVP